MGFLSSLFRRPDDVEEMEESEEMDGIGEEEQLKPSASKFPKLRVGMDLAVTIHKGEPLLAGRLTRFSGTELTIERKPGQLSFDTCAIGADVRIRGYGDDAMPFDLKGSVTESSRMKLSVKGLEQIVYDESRNNFRLSLSSPVTLYDPEDAQMKNPEEAELVNISVTGACFQTEYIHCEGEVLRIKFQLQDYIPRTLLGQIVRVEETPDGKFRYGFLFAQLSDMESNALTRELFNIQTGYRKERKREGPGHW